ncbi:hypothetical protein Y032_0009g790 [Ancylostoma ceylanicum]|uniref:Uncharacterized protein n=1 Tax=Ancylostoma ceylanicum TaxID=53326 RepID=A0A016VIZ7_9BILA|nr:hypothetical protein Y032_0009g790 [Ancylostoma ceylanicum]
MIRSFVQELQYNSIAPDSSDPDPVRGEKTVFNPVNPVEVPVFGFTYGHRVRVVFETLNKSNCIFKASKFSNCFLKNFRQKNRKK